MSDGNMNGELTAFIGVDVGGTHTDAQVLDGNREARGKALTTYDDFSRGVLGSIGVAAENLGISLDTLLGRTQLLLNATTVVTNVIAQSRGSRVGVIVTEGFSDEFRFAGGPRLRELDDHLQTNVPALVDRRDVVSVAGRIDHAGRELVGLDENGVRRAATFLVDDRKVEAIAICFLSSYRNAAHEQRAEAIVNELYPDLFVTPSHRISSVRGEYPRWITAVLNCFVSRDAHVFLDTVSTKLKSAGLGGSAAFFQGLGGGISQERAAQFPLALLGAGPAGGATGANELARQLGLSQVLLGDMGGTSFDTGLIFNNEIPISKDVHVGRFRTVLPLVDVTSVGAGGGSIAWISERGVPQVGPRSAGSTPGPAAYGNGGTEPTVTDAMVAMDFIDVDNYLGGKLKLRKDLATEALATTFADRMGWSVEESAAAVHDLVVTTMANAVREVSVNKGYDPREFVFMAYGGTLPWFAVEIARALDIAEVIVPNNSSVFCARGLLMSDFVLRRDITVQLTLSSEEELEKINSLASGLVSGAVEEMGAEGFDETAIRVARSADVQFAGQVHALPVPLPDRQLGNGDVTELYGNFTEIYERTYGAGTAWPEAPRQVLNYTVTVTGDLSRPPLPAYPLNPVSPEAVQKSERNVYLPSERGRRMIPIYDEALFAPGTVLRGPAIVESRDTTLFVPGGSEVRRDEYLNMILDVRSEG